MKNYFFDFLPNDIQYFIHQIVLSNYIVRNYFTKAQQKKRLIKEISLYNEYSKLPNTIECKIESTDASIKNQTASSSYKPAILESGVKINVPPFVESGEKIVIDTRTLEYVKRVSK